MRKIATEVKGMKIEGLIMKDNQLNAEEIRLNLQHEITKVKSNQFGGEFKEYYQLKFWGDLRIKGLNISNVEIQKGKVDKNTQPLHSCKFYKLSDAITVMLETYRVLTTFNRSYVNKFADRKELKIETITTQTGFDNLVLSKNRYIEVNGETMYMVRDFVDIYLNNILKGSGFRFVGRKGAEGTPDTNRKKYILLDIEEEYIFTIVTPFTKKELKMPKISIKDAEFVSEMILALEYISSQVFNATENFRTTSIETF